MSDRPAQLWLRERRNPARVRRLAERLTGRKLDRGTLSRWARGEMEMSVAAEVLIELLRQHPDLIGD